MSSSKSPIEFPVFIMNFEPQEKHILLAHSQTPKTNHYQQLTKVLPTKMTIRPNFH